MWGIYNGYMGICAAFELGKKGRFVKNILAK